MNHYVYYIGMGLVAIALTACNQSPDSTESNGRIISTHPNSSQSVSSTNPLNKDTNVAVSPVNTDSATDSKNLQTLGKQTVRIFYENCVLTGANSQKIAEQSKKNQLFELSDKQKQAFDLSAEHVWGVNTIEGGQYFVETDKNRCSVKAHYADEMTVRAEVQNMVTQTAKQLGLTSQLVSDRDNVNQLPIKELVYTMQKADAASQYVVTAYTSMSDKTPVKATLNFRLIPVK